MILKYSGFVIFLFSVFVSFASKGHPVLDFPTGGENFQAGEIITIQWHIAIEHEQEDWDLYFSPDGGQTWETIVSDLRPDELEYSWQIPEVDTFNGIIRVVMDNVDGVMDYDDISGGFSIESQGKVTGINEKPERELTLKNMPNPFNSQTQIHFKIMNTTHVTLSIYDSKGSKVEILLNRELPPGEYDYLWDGSQRSPGIYYYNLITTELKNTKRMVLVR